MTLEPIDELAKHRAAYTKALAESSVPIIKQKTLRPRARLSSDGRAMPASVSGRELGAITSILESLILGY